MIFENELKNFVSANFDIWSTLFWWHQKRELKRHKAFFDSVEKQPLTDLQRRSIILDERRNLVVAGAGTGKTSVIVAKAGYLLKSGKCRPEEILLLAFNSPAAAELRERCEKRLGTIIEALTFHKLGKTIIEAAAGHSQTVSKLATDPAKFQNLIDDYIQEIQLQNTSDSPFSEPFPDSPDFHQKTLPGRSK